MHLGLTGLAASSNGEVNPNALAAAVLVIASVSLPLLLSRSWRLWPEVFVVSGGLAATGVVTLVLCRSRVAWLTVWLMLVGTAVYGTRSRVGRIVLGAMIVLPVFAAGAAVVFLSREAFTTAAADVWTSANDRATIMSAGFRHLRESPWLGVGLNEFRTLFHPGGVDVAHAHNIVLQTALDLGIAGSLAYWSIVALLLVRARGTMAGASAAVRATAAGAALSLIASSLFGLLDAVPLGSKVGIFQWMSGGLILAGWRIQADRPLADVSAEPALRHEARM